MKKIFTTLFVLLAAYTIASAQTSQGTEFGVNIGYNSAYVTDGQSNQTTAFVSGFNAGVSADHYFSDRWSLKVKAIYDQKGWGDGFISTSSSQTNGINFKLSYITVPVMANWHFGRNRNWYLDFGPYVGFLLSAKAAGYNTDLKDGFNSVDGGLALGIGYKFPINETTNFFIEYDGQSGVTNIFKDSNGGNYLNARGSFNIGINFY